MTISMLAIGVNRHFNYDQYFSMVPVGPRRRERVLEGLLRARRRAEAEAADGRDPRGRRRIRADRGRWRHAKNAKKHGFKIVYDQSYPPTTTDFAPIMRAVQAANADIVFVAAYPPDNVGIIRAAQRDRPRRRKCSAAP